MSNLKRIRERAGLTVFRLSILSEVTSSAIYMIERDPSPNPTMATARKLADALGCTVEELFPEPEHQEAS